MELWHVLNRGVDGRNIFLDDKDYLRFVHNLYVFNDTTPADNNSGYHFKSMDLVSPYLEQGPRNKLVDIHGWCLMKNHYHLLLSERCDGGLSQFLRKLNVGYAKSFNDKYTRVGTLFQGRTKKVLVDRQAHANYILHYIHLNPLDYLKGAQTWRDRSHGGIQNKQVALDYLANYRWSSYLDYIERQNFSSLLTTSLFKDMLGNYRHSIDSYLTDAEADLTKMRLE
ncbi:hypothetical protein COU19_00205 [Candidatus Kaiserbacteria bacterium CG10_big_fil_rev_8_21_14_0_10_56_12]|uniref:Transposase IS200-like domain-containing protein n=1 Tax=Candidatus Kaiserbacteria bacterium CG10_big_fil_rev_8_21_14_0_10_56_12 TaxID=1974611 RepID=A0A2H0UAS7_9BACT|nr:MAG: hypothetical protein COU19_00205 [Candidatus Kaiserbacteria bacterium CG10_big_fil_rev_8_21_14_0_10_56_12]